MCKYKNMMIKMNEVEEAVAVDEEVEEAEEVEEDGEAVVVEDGPLLEVAVQEMLSCLKMILMIFVEEVDGEEVVVDEEDEEAEEVGWEMLMEVQKIKKIWVTSEVDIEVPGEVDMKVPGEVDMKVPGEVDMKAPGEVATEAPGVVDIQLESHLPLVKTKALCLVKATEEMTMILEEDIEDEVAGEVDIEVEVPGEEDIEDEVPGEVEYQVLPMVMQVGEM